MIEDIQEKVSVSMFYDRDTKKVMPYLMKWHGTLYRLTILGFHHKYREGRTLVHIFSVSDGNMSFKLKFDTDSLHWTLERVSDGNAN